MRTQFDDKNREPEENVKREMQDETDVTPEELEKYVIVQIEETDSASFYSK